jgi:hypothetical protein
MVFQARHKTALLMLLLIHWAPLPTRAVDSGFFVECRRFLHVKAQQLRAEWLALFNWERIKTVERNTKYWIGKYGVHYASVETLAKKLGLVNEVLYLIPPDSSQARTEFHQTIGADTIAFVMVKGWYANNVAPFHAFVRIGSRAFRLSPDGGIQIENYADIVETLLTRPSGPEVEIRETVFTVSDSAKRSLEDYFMARFAGQVGSHAFSTRYAVDGIEPAYYDDNGNKVENCVTFAISCIEPQWKQVFPGLTSFQNEACFHAPPGAKALSAQAIMGYVVFTAKPTAIVIWSKMAYDRLVELSTVGKADEFFLDFLHTLGGKRKLEARVVRNVLF